jgi:hypothetical protein
MISQRDRPSEVSAELLPRLSQKNLEIRKPAKNSGAGRQGAVFEPGARNLGD